MRNLARKRLQKRMLSGFITAGEEREKKVRRKEREGGS